MQASMWLFAGMLAQSAELAGVWMDPVWAARAGLMLEPFLHCSGLNGCCLPSASSAGDMMCRTLKETATARKPQTMM